VNEAFILKESGADVGFEESALQAALNSEWKPATVDGDPVELWVAYEVEFKFKRR